eukprot:3972607-Pyramimonas_sp.AAC.1
MSARDLLNWSWRPDIRNTAERQFKSFTRSNRSRMVMAPGALRSSPVVFGPGSLGLTVGVGWRGRAKGRKTLPTATLPQECEKAWVAKLRTQERPRFGRADRLISLDGPLCFWNKRSARNQSFTCCWPTICKSRIQGCRSTLGY